MVGLTRVETSLPKRAADARGGIVWARAVGHHGACHHVGLSLRRMAT